jgi:hypothetical protein
MGTLTGSNPNARELLTEILDKTRWWSTLSLIVEFLRAKQVERVHIEFGTRQGQNRIVPLVDLEAVIKAGFDEGTIEWARNSDFVFRPLGSDLALMLCNDADLHFASVDSALLMELGHKIRSNGIKVFDSGKLI